MIFFQIGEVCKNSEVTKIKNKIKIAWRKIVKLLQFVPDFKQM